MYPFLRLAATMLRARRAAPMGLTDAATIRLRCWPWDCDMFGEMNNGRILTLFDLGRFDAGERFGLSAMLKREGWGLAVAGSSTRYRKRILPMAKVEMRTRLVGWDDPGRFFYLVQEMWVGDACACQALLRTAVTARGRGAIPTEEVMAALGRSEPSPALPPWVAAWAEADATRPWPPKDAPPPSAG